VNFFRKEKQVSKQTVTQSAQSVQHPQGAGAPRYDRQPEHSVDAIRLVNYLLSIPQDNQRDGWPSTAELQADGRFGLRPVNRLVDLRHGKYNHHRYDIEMMPCGRGVNRWRIHWPNRPGYPKQKEQGVLSLPAPKPPVEWEDRKAVVGLELWDAVR
jgi:hypothetical protein